MKKFFFVLFVLVVCSANVMFAQIPTNTLVQIVKAEDERRYDATLESLLKNPDATIRRRTALAAGRIGDERAIPALVAHLNDDPATAAMIIFALGEIESPNAASQIAEILNNTAQSNEIRARAIEAAGKIAAANPKDAQTPELGKAIVSALENEFGKGLIRNRETVLLGITAVLRSRSEGGEAITANFLDDSDARIRADALNTLARLRSKKVNEKARELLARDLDPIVRANAARMLGVGEDKSAIELLLNAATKDVDSRVRVSAIRSLGSFKETDAAKKIFDALSTNINKNLSISGACRAAHTAATLSSSNPPGYKLSEKELMKINSNCPSYESEYLEIVTSLGKLFQNSYDKQVLFFLTNLNPRLTFQSPEGEIALAKIAPSNFAKLQKSGNNSFTSDWKAINALMAGIGELASAPDTAENKQAKNFAKSQVLTVIRGQLLINHAEDKVLSDALTAYAAFKPEDLAEVLRDSMNHKDAVVRATAAGLLAESAATKENVESLRSAFTKSLLIDKQENDAQLAILNALYKIDKKSAVGIYLIALKAPDYLVRKRAAEILKDSELQEYFSGIQTNLKIFAVTKGNQVLPYAAYKGTKLGQVLNTDADYIRAVSRKNGTVKAVFATTKGNFTIDFFPEDAPLAVDNFIKLARANYFNGVSVHRVVPNFVMQDGDPRGDGNGGPGWQIRCEINTLPYERGTVGMALSGKDTGGSQWFVTHSPQPHLDGGYTVFGRVNENDMKVIDNIVRGDKILKVRIVENSVRQRAKAGSGK
jgi:cyclophilin family peptidyl-prolyl cis-trans isomerase/HEAT repeat protein